MAPLARTGLLSALIVHSMALLSPLPRRFQRGGNSPAAMLRPGVRRVLLGVCVCIFCQAVEHFVPPMALSPHRALGDHLADDS